MNEHRAAKILIVDDDATFCLMLSDMVEMMGHDSSICHRISCCRQMLEQRVWDLLLLDVGLPDGDGLSILPWIRSMDQAPEVIIITGAGDADGAKLAITNGAWDYLMKTTPIERVNLIVDRALKHRQTVMELRTLKTVDRKGIIGHSVAIQHCLDRVNQAIHNDFNVLITGESGTGKELFARAIHANSERQGSGPFVVVDCAALPQTLIESVLFGHVKGAFTGAEKDKTGLIHEADGGTLFLDEIGELPLDLQKILLRVLQEKRYRPVGSTKEEKSDFRLIAATNKNLDAMVLEETFREDLLFRLRSITIHLPPLRERLEDLPELASHFLAKARGDRYGNLPGGAFADSQPKRLSRELTDALLIHPWPGNIRELHHVVEAAAAASFDEKNLLIQHLPPALRIELTHKKMKRDQQHKDDAHPFLSEAPTVSKSGAVTDETIFPTSMAFSTPDNHTHTHSSSSSHGPFPTIRDYRQQQDARYLQKLMHQVGGDMHRAAEEAGLSLSRLYSLLREHGVKPLK